MPPGLPPGGHVCGGHELDADREGDSGARMEGGPDARQRGDQPEPGLLRDADPARTTPRPPPGRPGPAAAGTGWSGLGGTAAGDRSAAAGPVVRAGTGATQARVRGAGRVDRSSGHAGHHPSVVASGWGSPVSAASAAATSARLART